ncbi:hypothetical protein GCM10019059_05060 [Camelimonas fluminis]|nr:hypothetical protein GCM10019059_05060 [Camelimonas fluminis]
MVAGRQRVDAHVTAFNAGDREPPRALFTPDANSRGVPGWVPVNGAIPIWRELHENTCMRLEISGVVSDGATAAALLHETGRFVGAFRGLAGHEPTGKHYELLAIEWFAFSGNLIARRWAARDSGALARQALDHCQEK